MFIVTRTPEAEMPDRLQQEIADLLARLDTFPPPRPRWVRVRDTITRTIRSAGLSITGIPFPRLSAGHVLLVAIGVIVFGYLALPEGSGLTQWVIAAAIIVFIGAFVMSLRRSGSGGRPAQKYWRDKPLDLRSPGRGRSWWDRRRKR